MEIRLYISVLILSLLQTQAQEIHDTLGNSSLKGEDSTNLKIVRLNLNSEYSDFSPFMLKGQLFFVSGRDNNGAIKYTDHHNGSEITDIYVATPKDSVRYKNTHLCDAPVNSKNYEGPFCFNSTGTIIYFTKSDHKTGSLKIYQSEKTNGKWSEPEILPFCLNGYSYCHPALAPGDAKMVFASNQDPKNKMDLFISECVNGKWTSPKTLGSRINDTASQVFPFIAGNNTLYFSTRKAGKADLDIYGVDLNSSTATPTALPSPINSSADDFGIWFDVATNSGYFSSDRNKRCKDDIYYFGNVIPQFADWPKLDPKKTFCYTFFEERLAQYPDTSKTIFEWDFGDGKKGKGLRARHCYEKPGEYTVKLNTVDHISGEIFTNETTENLTIEKPNALVLDCKEAIAEGQPLLIRTDNCYLKGCVVDKMYWSFGDGNYNRGKTVKHIYKKPGNYKIQVGLVARDTSSNKFQRYKIEKEVVVLKKN
jgi:hypothetical protein